MVRDGAKMAAVNDGERDGGERHAEEIEEKGRSVAESILNEDKGCSPDGDDAEEQEVGEGGWVWAGQSVSDFILERCRRSLR